MIIETGGYGCPKCGNYKKEFDHDRMICYDCARIDNGKQAKGPRAKRAPGYGERLDVGFMLLNDEFDEHEPHIQSSFDIWGR